MSLRRAGRNVHSHDVVGLCDVVRSFEKRMVAKPFAAPRVSRVDQNKEFLPERIDVTRGMLI